MSSYFPVDVWSVKEYGVEKWRTELFWPVPDTEFFSLLKTVDALYVNTIGKAAPELCDIFLAAYKLTIHYAMFIHAVIVTERLRSEGLVLKYDPTTAYYDGLINKEHRIIGLPVREMPAELSLWQRLKVQARLALTRIRNQGWDLSYYFGSSNRPHILSWGYPSRDRELYAQIQNKKITIINPILWATTGTARPPDVLLSSDAVVSELIRDLQDSASNHGVSLQEKHLGYLETLTNTYLRSFGISIEEIRQRMRYQDQATIMVNQIGAPLTRCFCVAARHHGCQIVGFPHGHNFGQDDISLTSHLEFSMVDIYAASTNGSAALFSRMHRRYPLPYGRQTRVVCLNNRAWKELWMKNSRKPLPSSIQTVMFIEYPLTQHRHHGIYAFWAYQLELLLRVATFARQLGAKTIIKRHPDRLKESDGLYDDYFDELIVTRFEEVFDSADAYFFPNLLSTTFAFALLTNKPIIILDALLEGVWPDSRVLLKKRCRAVPSWFDENGNLMFDEEALAEALTRKPEEPDDEFVRKYMFPSS